MLNLIQTSISENCNTTTGFFLRDLGVPCKTEWYIFCVANERILAVQKLRVLIVKEQLLIDIINGNYEHVDIPGFEHTYSSNRWSTIVKMAKMYQEQKEQIFCHGLSDLMRVSICIFLTSRLKLLFQCILRIKRHFKLHQNTTLSHKLRTHKDL
jgi:hypothetical protein